MQLRMYTLYCVSAALEDMKGDSLTYQAEMWCLCKFEEKNLLNISVQYP